MGEKELALDNLPDTPKSTLTFEVDSSSNVRANLVLRSKLNNILPFESTSCQPVSTLLGAVEEAASQLKIVRDAGTADRKAEQKLRARQRAAVDVGGSFGGRSTAPDIRPGRGHHQFRKG